MLFRYIHTHGHHVWIYSDIREKSITHEGNRYHWIKYTININVPSVYISIHVNLVNIAVHAADNHKSNIIV